ncbi:MAG: cyclic nucleotide-binding domain-containing protein [Gammaproteobacteria bacterium]|nr:cyclic nucleotide-binding domain-containing protein [Gammaproteobacteria bacterium]
MPKNLIKTLKKSPLFKEFSKKQLEQVVAHLKPGILTLKPGDVLYQRGEDARCCWLIQSGNLTVRRLSLRTPFRHMIYHEGSVTGIQGLVSPGTPRSVTMIAEDDVELIEVTREGLGKLDKSTQIQLWKNVSSLLLRKLLTCLSRESLDP